MTTFSMLVIRAYGRAQILFVARGGCEVVVFTANDVMVKVECVTGQNLETVTINDSKHKLKTNGVNVFTRKNDF